MISASLCFSELVDRLDVLVGELLRRAPRRGAPRRRRPRRLVTSSLRWCMTSRRTFRTATRPSSAIWRTILTSSLRRSSVSCGIGRRMILPSFDGVRPRSDSWIAFSIWLHRARVERLDRQHARLGHADRRELLQRRLLPVVVDRDSVEQCRRRAARAHGVELGARVPPPPGPSGVRRPASARRLSPCLLPGVEMIVPTRSPATTRRMFPSLLPNT